QGRTVFLSSHILPEVDAVADRVGIVRESRLIAVDTVEAFKAKAHSTVSIQFASPVNETSFSDLDGVRSAELRNGGTVVAITVSGSLDTVIKEAANHDVVSISTRDSELEDVFLSYYAGDMDVS
ncbi:MAG: ABC transporter ATP-binding protein, partial [Acidimicrobiia bacterium]